MTAAEQMEDFITDILARFSPGGSGKGKPLVLAMPNYRQLVIEYIIPNVLVRIAQMVPGTQNQMACEPEIFCWIAHGEWIPYAVNWYSTGWRGYAQFNPLTNQLEYVNEDGQYELASEVDELATIWREVGWIERAVVVTHSSNTYSDSD